MNLTPVRCCRRVLVLRAAFPIGIDPSRFEECLETTVVKDKIIDLQRRFDGKKVCSAP
jgi:trehalose-6-phosphate synthase